MNNKKILNESWEVRDLISKIENKSIIKPQYQRKKKWNTHPNIKKENVPESNHI